MLFSDLYPPDEPSTVWMNTFRGCFGGVAGAGGGRAAEGGDSVRTHLFVNCVATTVQRYFILDVHLLKMNTW